MSSKTASRRKKKNKPLPIKDDGRSSFVKPSTAPRSETKLNTGRRPLEIDYTKLEQFMWCNPTLTMTSLFFEVSNSTIEAMIKERYGLSFDEFRSKNIMFTRKTLVQKAVQMAIEKDNVAALIFSLKNLAGWTDNIQMSVQPTQTIQLKYSLDKPPQPPSDPIDVTPPKEIIEVNNGTKEVS